MAEVAVVIVNYRTPELTVRCIEALKGERNKLPSLRVIVVDGASGDNSAADIRAFVNQPAWIHWVSFVPLEVNGGFGWANNQAILHLAGSDRPPQFIHLLNPDTEICPGAVVQLANYLEAHSRTAAAGSQLINVDGSLAGSAFSFPTVRGEFSRGASTGFLAKLLRVPPIAIEAPRAREVDWVTGGSVMLRMSALAEVGLFDEGFFLYNEEVELMWRFRKAGWKVAIEPLSRVIHIGGAATGVVNPTGKDKLERRLPPYVFRSRSRYFGLTRGRAVAAAAYGAWLTGNVIWWTRRTLGLAKGAPTDHQFRDHLRAGRPRAHDTIACPATLTAVPGKPPAWMERQWL